MITREEYEKPLVVPVYCDNGEFSHWTLIEAGTGKKLWSEDPKECKAMGYPVEEIAIDVDIYKLKTQSYKNCVREVIAEINRKIQSCKLILADKNWASDPKSEYHKTCRLNMEMKLVVYEQVIECITTDDCLNDYYKLGRIENGKGL